MRRSLIGVCWSRPRRARYRGSGCCCGIELAGMAPLSRALRARHGTHIAPRIRHLFATLEANRVAVLVEGDRTRLIPMCTSEQHIKADINHFVPPLPVAADRQRANGILEPSFELPIVRDVVKVA